MDFHPITGWFGINNVIGWVGFNFPLVFLVGCGMDIKVIRFGYGWEWIGFFAISRPRWNGPSSSHDPKKGTSLVNYVLVFSHLMLPTLIFSSRKLADTRVVADAVARLRRCLEGHLQTSQALAGLRWSALVSLADVSLEILVIL